MTNKSVCIYSFTQIDTGDTLGLAHTTVFIAIISGSFVLILISVLCFAIGIVNRKRRKQAM